MQGSRTDMVRTYYMVTVEMLQYDDIKVRYNVAVLAMTKESAERKVIRNIKNLENPYNQFVRIVSIHSKNGILV